MYRSMHTGLSNWVLCYWMPSRDHIRFQLRHAQRVHRHPPSIPPPCEPAYDTDGNVTAYISESGDTVATYEYDAFGATISQLGTLADSFRHRFSTKYYDAETGFYYSALRYYSPALRRWLSRDPIEEEGG